MPPAISAVGLQKAAILMVLLGEDVASNIYRQLPEGDVERLTRRIAELEPFKPETALSVLEEYHRLTLTQGYLADGGPVYAEKLLIKAFGENGAQRLLQQVKRTMEQSAAYLENLQKYRSPATGEVPGDGASPNHRPDSGAPGRAPGIATIGAVAGRCARGNRQAAGAAAAVFSGGGARKSHSP